MRPPGGDGGVHHGRKRSHRRTRPVPSRRGPLQRAAPATAALPRPHRPNLACPPPAPPPSRGRKPADVLDAPYRIATQAMPVTRSQRQGAPGGPRAAVAARRSESAPRRCVEAGFERPVFRRRWRIGVAWRDCNLKRLLVLDFRPLTFPPTRPRAARIRSSTDRSGLFAPPRCPPRRPPASMCGYVRSGTQSRRHPSQRKETT